MLHFLMYKERVPVYVG